MRWHHAAPAERGPLTLATGWAPRRQWRWDIENDVALSIDVGLDERLCGIDTLELANGQRCVGQSVNLASRIAAQRRRWSSILAVAFVASRKRRTLRHLDPPF